ncbi:hypothetical protein B0T19DRAFT_40078 [Cercophora scortea]|uniref:PX domain-containing protein n=1 Tax=Cercophora scortea TaxID=314031 RepID=A0AAE0J3Z0_9PEZI|nr:hypothetical protein B0T19DRAFT_40078 [Cercophora scortea]
MTLITLPQPPSPIPSRPQLHSRKHHHTYNGIHSLPTSTQVRPSSSPSSNPPPLTNTHEAGAEPEAILRPAYEVTLYYAHNRACTIYRTSDDFATLRNGLTAWQDAPALRKPEEQQQEQQQAPHGSAQDESQYLDHFLREALAKRPYECAMEFFLRRRMGDCEGR